MAIIDFSKWIRSSVKLLNKYLDNFQETYEANKYKSWLFFKSIIQRTKGEVVNPLDVVIRKPGNFYLFAYQAKGYEEGTLPWYDKYPLIVVLDVYNTGFLGINYHWILPIKRALILKKLILEFNVHFFNDERLLGLNYRRLITLLGPYNRRLIKVAIRRYRWDHVKSVVGLRACRIRNIEMIDSIAMISPMYAGITPTKAERWIKENTRSYKAPVIWK